VGMAGLNLGTATHTWGWRIYVWGWPKKLPEKKFYRPGRPSILSFEKRQFSHSRHHSGGQEARSSVDVVGDAASLAPPSAGKSVPMRFAPPRPFETTSRPRRSAAAGSEQMSAAFVGSATLECESAISTVSSSSARVEMPSGAGTAARGRRRERHGRLARERRLERDAAALRPLRATRGSE